jgi:hypothetical protein
LKSKLKTEYAYSSYPVTTNEDDVICLMSLVLLIYTVSQCVSFISTHQEQKISPAMIMNASTSTFSSCQGMFENSLSFSDISFVLT